MITATMITMLTVVEIRNDFSRERSRSSRVATSCDGLARAHAATASRNRSVSVGRSRLK